MNVFRYFLISFLVVFLAIFANRGFTQDYSSYTVTNGNDQSGGEFIISYAGDVDGDDVNDFMIVKEGTYQPVFIVLAKAVGDSKVIDLSKADYRIDQNNYGNLEGREVKSIGDVDGDGGDDFFISEPGETYSEDVDEMDVILSSELYQFSTGTHVVVSDQDPSEATVSVGVGISASKDTGCALNID